MKTITFKTYQEYYDKGKTKVDINLRELSIKSGKSELELAKSIIILLAIKAEVTKIPQRVVCHFPKGSKVLDTHCNKETGEFEITYRRGNVKGNQHYNPCRR